jgi:hypothetical protein
MPGKSGKNFREDPADDEAGDPDDAYRPAACEALNCTAGKRGVPT